MVRFDEEVFSNEENCSHAYVVANASFSICAYLHSVSDDTGRHTLSICWKSTVPSPCDEASAETFVGAAPFVCRGRATQPIACMHHLNTRCLCKKVEKRTSVNPSKFGGT